MKPLKYYKSKRGKGPSKDTVRLKMRVTKGDLVMVISGDDKGKRGKVLQAIPTRQRVIVEGVNVLQTPARRGRTTSGRLT